MPKHSVLIVGGGIAGMRAALAAKERGADVGLISKVHPLRTQGGTSQGGINAAVRDGDSAERHAADTVKGGDYLGEQAAVELLTGAARSAVVTLICSRGRTPIGFALYFFTYSTFVARPSLYLEDLFVLPGERGRGAGRALLKALAKIAVGRGCGRLEWTVLDWNAPAIGFYEGLGAQLKREWVLTRLTGEPLRRLARG